MRFLLTKELGRLAKWLRIMGFDTEYFSEAASASLIIQALRDDRVIITRNHHLPASRGIKIIVLRSESVKKQLVEVLKSLNIQPVSDMMFTRCTLCNVVLEPAAATDVMHTVPEYVLKTQAKFLRCPECKRVYWQGTHWGKAHETLRELWSS
jgi:uncharacterized protein with PIN domain